MILSFKYLKTYVKINITIVELVNKLNNIGIESICINNDTIEFFIPPDRSDLSSYIGMAREISIILNQDIIYPLIDDEFYYKSKFNINISNNLKYLYNRYTGLIIRNIDLKLLSPQWLIDYLHSVNIKSFNYIFDIANFILLETGQYINIIDLDKIHGNSINISKNINLYKYIQYNNEKINISNENIISYDKNRIISLSGMFTDDYYNINNYSKNVIFEISNFNYSFIKKISKIYNISTICSKNYNKFIDPNIIGYVIKRIIYIVRLVNKNVSFELLEDYYFNPSKSKVILYDINKNNNILGINISCQKIKTILKKLNFLILKSKNNFLYIKIPSYRNDITREVNIFKEIIRIYNINNISVNLIKPYHVLSINNNKNEIIKYISNYLISNNFFEIRTCPISSMKYLNLFNDTNHTDIVKIINYYSKEFNMMRHNMIISAINTIIHNLNRQHKSFMLYEIGKTYHFINNKYLEKNKISLWITGNLYYDQWNISNKKNDFFVLKGIIESIFRKLHINDFIVNDLCCSYMNYGIKIVDNNKNELVFLGKINEKINDISKINQDIFYAEINYDNLIKLYNNKINFHHYSKYPLIRRDLCLIVPYNINFKKICDIAYSIDNDNIIKNIFIFDIYDDIKLQYKIKSYTIGYILNSKSKTLTSIDVNFLMKKLIDRYKMYNIVIK